VREWIRVQLLQICKDRLQEGTGVGVRQIFDPFLDENGAGFEVRILRVGKRGNA
jgi:hypothetical protein